MTEAFHLMSLPVDSKPDIARRDISRVLMLIQAASSTILVLLVYLGLPFMIAYSVPPLLWVVTVVGLIFIWLAINFGIQSVNKWLEERSPCMHGIKGGRYGTCHACLLAAKLLQEQTQAEAARRNQEKLIRERALVLRKNEIKRLSAAWLTSSTAYLTMTPRQFEDAIAELFRKLGYKVAQTPFSNDGGKDAIAWKDGKKFLIECKRYQEDKNVGRRDVQIFHSAVIDAKAEEGFFVTTGSYAHTAVEYAKKHQIKIYDSKSLPWLVSQAYGSSNAISTAEVMCYDCGNTIFLPLGHTTPSGTCENGHEVLMNITLADLGVQHLYEPEIPNCPRCNSTMKKVNRFGRQFWGCSQFPKCRGTRYLLTRNFRKGNA